MLNLVLIADDDADGVLLLREAFHDAHLVCPIVDLVNGQEVIDYLSGARPFTDRELFPLPSLVLLDLHMPVANGFEVLAWRQTQLSLHALPIVVLTSSDLPDDKAKALRLGANEYLAKPTRHTELVKIVSELQERWLGAGKFAAHIREESKARTSHANRSKPGP